MGDGRPDVCRAPVRPAAALDDVAQIPVGPNSDVTPEQRIAAPKLERPATRDMPTECYLPSSASMTRRHGFAEERLGGAVRRSGRNGKSSVRPCPSTVRQS
jgi:hypothetical protein